MALQLLSIHAILQRVAYIFVLNVYRIYQEPLKFSMKNIANILILSH